MRCPPSSPVLGALLLFAACGGGALTGDAGVPGDGNASRPTVAGRWRDDDRVCGLRGLALALPAAELATACPPVTPDGGVTPAAPDVVVHLSDLVPGIYLGTDRGACFAAVGTRRFFAEVAGATSNGGAVVTAGIGADDHLRGTVDVSFVGPVGDAGAAPARFAVAFDARRCP